MPSTTATWRLTYPVGTDEFCQGPVFIQDLAVEVDALLATYNAFLDRIRTPPYASLRATVAQTFPSSISPAGNPTFDVSYDTVNADTDNYTNLPATPSVIIADMTDGVSNELPDGIYLWGQYMYMTQNSSVVETGVYGSNITTITPAINTPGGAQIEDGGTGVYMGETYWAPRQQTTVNGRIVMYTQVTTNNAVVNSIGTLVEGAFFFLWIGDNP